MASMVAKKSYSASYQLLEKEPELTSQSKSQTGPSENRDTTELDQPATRVSLWKAVVNLMSDMEGTGLLGLPYVIAQSGLVAIAALALTPFISCYTGNILIECLYEKNDKGERVRVRSNYRELGQACWPRFGGTVVTTVQLIELFLLASLYLVLCASLSRSIFPDVSISDRAWMVIAAAVGFPTLFLGNLSEVAWLSLLSVIALFGAVAAVITYGLAHVATWNGASLLIWDVDSIPLALVIIIFSYICHPVLPGVEASMTDKSQFPDILALSYALVAVLKIGFSVCAFLSFSPHISDVIVNSLPMGVVRTLINGLLILNVLFSYPFRVITIIQTIEDFVSPETLPFKPPYFVWFVAIRVLTNFLTLLPAITIPHFVLFMGFLGSLTGACVAFVFPCIFHLIIKKNDLNLRYHFFDVSIITIGFLASAFGLLYTGKSLFNL